MEYVIINTNPILNGISHSNFINILDVTGNTCNVNISNAESVVHTIDITNSDITESINNYFITISDTE